MGGAAALTSVRSGLVHDSVSALLASDRLGHAHGRLGAAVWYQHEGTPMTRSTKLKRRRRAGYKLTSTQVLDLLWGFDGRLPVGHSIRVLLRPSLVVLLRHGLGYAKGERNELD